MSIIKAWGVLEHTPLMLSFVLKSLNVSHSVMACTGPNCKYREIYGTANEQPAWPVVMQSISELNRVEQHVPYDRIIAFVFDSRAQIMNSNLTVWSPCIDMYNELQTILLQEDPVPFELKLNELSAMDYVKIASKPSVLSEIQTLWCKVNPYSLRKTIQEFVIRYLCSDIGETSMRRELNHSVHGADIYRLVTGGGGQLKQAVAAVRTGAADVDEAAAKFNIDPFDIRFLLNSLKKYV